MTDLRIWKYQLGNENQHEDDAMAFTIKVPDVHLWLDAQIQYGVLCIWALVNPATTPEKRTVRIIGTGWPAPVSGCIYVGTAQDVERGLVWHVFVDPATTGYHRGVS